MDRLANGGKLHSKEESNGFTKSEFRIELIAAEKDLPESRSQLTNNSVEQFHKVPSKVHGIQFSAKCHYKEQRSGLLKLKTHHSLSPELKSTWPFWKVKKSPRLSPKKLDMTCTMPNVLMQRVKMYRRSHSENKA
jgi:hypothetical protein